MSPTSGGSESRRTGGAANSEEGKFGGIWKKHASGEIPRGADQQFKLTPEELLALGAQDSPTHVRAGPHRPSHLHGLGDPR